MPEARGRCAGLYRSGSVAAAVVAVLLLGEIAVFAAFPRPPTARDHFELFARSPIAGLLTLDLLGMVAYVLMVPVMLAVYVAVRRHAEATSAVALVLFVIGVADFFATNTAFPVMALSQQYAAAGNEADQARILAAGEAMFALFNENAFLVSYVIVSASWALLGLALLRSPAFGRSAGIAAVLAGASGVAAVVLEHASTALVPVAIPVYFAAIAFLIVWMSLVSRGLWPWRVGACCLG
jgi:hypothetical protein